MIDTVIVGGVQQDPCVVFSTITVMHGRTQFGEQAQPMSATVTVEHQQGGMPSWQVGDSLYLGSVDADMFMGRIVQRSLAHEHRPDGSTVGIFTVTAAGPMAALGLRVVGDEPWPQESGLARAQRILTLAQVPWGTEGTVDAQILPRDVDAQPAAGLLQGLAEETSAAVFDNPRGEVIYQTLQSRDRLHPWMWADFSDTTDTWDTFDVALTWADMESWESPTSVGPVVLPCTAIVWEPEWASSEATVINHVRIGWGLSDPQDYVDLQDADSVERHGERYLYLGTQLAVEVDALARAEHILTTQRVERWEMSDVTVDLPALDPTTHDQVLSLVCGDQVTLQGFPQPAPAVDFTGIVEGWTFTQYADGGVWAEQMVLAVSDPMLSLVVMSWDDYPAAYLWSDHPTGMLWDDLENVDILESA